MNDVTWRETITGAAPTTAPSDQTLSNNASAAQNLAALMDMTAALYITHNTSLDKMPLKNFLADMERRILERCLSLTWGNQRTVAAILEVKPTSLSEKIRRHGLHDEHGRSMQIIAQRARTLLTQASAAVDVSRAGGIPVEDRERSVTP